MRLLVRSLSAFITSQVLSSDVLRVSASSSLISNHPAITELRGLRKNKSYSQFSQIIDRTVNYVQDTNHTILDAVIFLGQITKDLYEQKQYLCDVVKQAQ